MVQHTGARILNLSKNLTFYKVHIFQISFFTRFTFSKSHFSQNSHFPGLRQWPQWGQTLVLSLQDVGQYSRSQSGVGPLLPCLPSHLPSTASIDTIGAAIRLAQAPHVSQPGAGRTRLLHTPGCHQPDQHGRPLTPGKFCVWKVLIFVVTSRR